MKITGNYFDLETLVGVGDSLPLGTGSLKEDRSKHSEENIQFVKSRNLSIHAVKTVLTFTQLNTDLVGHALFPLGYSDGSDERSHASHYSFVHGDNPTDSCGYFSLNRGGDY